MTTDERYATLTAELEERRVDHTVPPALPVIRAIQIPFWTVRPLRRKGGNVWLRRIPAMATAFVLLLLLPGPLTDGRESIIRLLACAGVALTAQVLRESQDRWLPWLLSLLVLLNPLFALPAEWDLTRALFVATSGVLAAWLVADLGADGAGEGC